MKHHPHSPTGILLRVRREIGDIAVAQDGTIGDDLADAVASLDRAIAAMVEREERLIRLSFAPKDS